MFFKRPASMHAKTCFLEGARNAKKQEEPFTTGTQGHSGLYSGYCPLTETMARRTISRPDREVARNAPANPNTSPPLPISPYLESG
jgi:hypothetical protein